MSQTALIPQDREEGSAAHGGDTQQFVTFEVGNEIFAVPMAPVREIIRAPKVVRVPLSPPSLLGLANLRGVVLPVISLRSLFHFDDRPHDDATRALVIDFGTPAGFVVDRVASVMTVDRSQIEPADRIQATVDSDLLSGVIQPSAQRPMVMVLDFARLIQQEFAALERPRTAQATTALSTTTQAPKEATQEELQLVSFAVAGQEYAIAIDRVQEIVQVPDEIIHVPKAAPHVLGVMTLRQRMLPLVSLRQMFRLPAQPLSEHNRIVVISVGDQAVGVVTDTVNEVLRVNAALVEPMPSLLSRDTAIEDITAICRLNDGKRLVSIVSPDKMFAHQGLLDLARQLQPTVAATGEVAAAEADSSGADDEQMVVFRLMNEEFGVVIEAVQEIVRVPEQLTRVPKAPPFVEGVINLRGTVLPVIDQRRRFGLPPLARNDRQRIVVFTIRGVDTGFIVDSVSEVLKIPHRTIEEAPSLADGQQGQLVRRIANLQQQKRMILLLDVGELLGGQELAAVAQTLPK